MNKGVRNLCFGPPEKPFGGLVLWWVILICSGIIPPQSCASQVVVKNMGAEGALRTANDFLEAWKGRNVEKGLRLLSPGLKKAYSPEELKEYLVGLSNPHHFDFNIGEAIRLSSIRYAFPVLMYEEYTGYKVEKMKGPFSMLMMVFRGEEWRVSKLPFSFNSPADYDAKIKLMKQIIEEDPKIEPHDLTRQSGFTDQEAYLVDNYGNGEVAIFLGGYRGDKSYLVFQGRSKRVWYKGFENIGGASMVGAMDLDGDGRKELFILTAGGNGWGGSFSYVIGRRGDEVVEIFRSPTSHRDGTIVKDLDGDTIDEIITEEVIGNEKFEKRMWFPTQIYKWTGKGFENKVFEYPKYLQERYRQLDSEARDIVANFLDKKSPAFADFYEKHLKLPGK